MYLKYSKEQEQIKPQNSKLRETLKIRVKVNKIETN